MAVDRARENRRTSSLGMQDVAQTRWREPIDEAIIRNRRSMHDATHDRPLRTRCKRRRPSTQHVSHRVLVRHVERERTDTGSQCFDCLHDFDTTLYSLVCLLPPTLPGRQPRSSGEQQMTRTAFSQPARDLEANTPEAARYEITRVSSAREGGDAAARDEPLKSQDVTRAPVDQSNAVFGLGSEDLGRNPGRRRG